MKAYSSPTTNEMESLRNHISQLANLSESSSPIISAYLDLCETKDYLKSKLAMWATAARSTLDSKQRIHFDDARREVVGVIAREWSDEIRSVAVFSRGGEDPLLLVIPFSVSLDLHFDASNLPSIFGLVQLKDRFHRFVRSEERRVGKEC